MSTFSFVGYILNDYDRRNLLAIISSDSLARLLKSNNCNYSRGKPQLEGMTSTLMLIPRKDNFFIMNSRRRRK